MCLRTEEKRMNICSSRAVNSSTIHSSSITMGSGNALIDPFPAGLRVLVVDDDLCCLAVLQRKLQKCQYEVTIHNRADVALELLRKDKTGFDIVLSDVHMPDMDGFKLLECVGLEMDLPVIMMSGDDSKDVVMKGVIHGACDYLIKPISIEALKTIWQHVVRKKKKDRKEMEFEQAGIVEDGEQQQNPLEDADYLSSSYEENQKDSNKRKDEAKYMDDRSTSKKPRVVWSAELHQQFITSVNQIGIDRAVPKKILEVMNVPGLTRENVASHLQKFRLYLRKLSTSSQHQNGLDNSFMGPRDVPFGSISSFNGLGLQALAAPGQMIRPLSLATIQADSLSKVTPKAAISLPLIDQRNTFRYENKKSRFGEGQTQLNDNSKQTKLLHGIPTNMEPKQLASSLHQYTDTFGNGSHISGISPYFGQPTLSQSFPGGVHTRSEFDNVCGALFNPISHTSKGELQEEVKSDMKDSRGFLANFGDSTDLNQNENRDWGLYNIGPIFDPTQHSNTSQQVNSSLADNAPSGAGKLPDMGFLSTPFLEQFNQEDFWSLILQQPEDGIGLVEGEFGFDGYHLENLPA